MEFIKNIFKKLNIKTDDSKGQNSEKLKDVLNQKNTEIQAIFDLAASETREPTNEEKQNFQTLQSEVKEIEKVLETIEEEENKPVKVEFLKSPTGVYGLGYNEGDKAKVKAVLANKMIADKTAKKVK